MGRKFSVFSENRYENLHRSLIPAIYSDSPEDFPNIRCKVTLPPPIKISADWVIQTERKSQQIFPIGLR